MFALALRLPTEKLAVTLWAQIEATLLATPIDQAADVLVGMAHEAGSKDNITAIVVRVDRRA